MASNVQKRPVTRLKSLKDPPHSRGRLNARTCPNPACGASGDKITDDADKRVCTECGMVLSDSNIVSEVQFGETSSGAAVVQGSYVGADQTHARSLGTAFKRAGGMESREITDANGKRYINQLSTALNISATTADQAFRHYKLAAAQNFIQGRRTKNVAAVCLYIACRKDPHSPFMLIDFSDLLQINVFKLGRTYLDICQQVPVKSIPAVIPETLIHRFAARLEFGDKMNKVANDAIRIVQRMSRDWMVAGRRPSGICGACLILAARMNNFRRTVREVVYVVKVTDVTIQKRLDEFKVTESSGLTVDQFRSIWLEKAHDPPAFYESKNKKKRKRVRKVNESGEAIPEEDEDGNEVQRERQERQQQEELERNQDRDARNERDEQQDREGGEDRSEEDTIQRAITILAEPKFDDDGYAIPDIPIDPTLLEASSNALDALKNGAGGEVGSTVGTEQDDGTSEPSSKRRRTKAPAKQKAPKTPVVTQAELYVEDEVERDMMSYLDDPIVNEMAAKIAANTATSIQPDASIPMTEDILEEEFADDPEVMNCLLGPEEVDIKERIWIHENKDYLREQQNKRLRKETEAANRGGAAKVVRRRKRKGRIGEGGDGTPANSPAESVLAMLQRRGYSKKINYAAIEALFEKDENGLTPRGGEPEGSAAREPIIGY